MLRNLASSIGLALISLFVSNYFLFVASGINPDLCLMTVEEDGVAKCVGLLSFLPSTVQFFAFLLVVGCSVFGGIQFYKQLAEEQKQQRRNEEVIKQIRNGTYKRKD